MIILYYFIFLGFSFDAVLPRTFRYVMCSIDATVWPSSTQYLLECVTMLQNVCSLGPFNCGHVQAPLFHQATTVNALVKHSRKLEDALLKTELEMQQKVVLFFQKEPSRAGSDKRPLTQMCYAPYSSKACKWTDSEAHSTGVLHGLPLIRVSDMEGYDPDNGLRPGAAARIEQWLGIKNFLEKNKIISSRRQLVISFNLLFCELSV